MSKIVKSRRDVLVTAGAATLSASTFALVAGCATPAKARSVDVTRPNVDVGKDIRILNTAISAEHEAVAAYALGAGSGLLTEGVAKVAIAFQGHHKEHIDALSKAVKKLGGAPSEPLAKYDFPVEKLTDEKAVLTFAASLERGAVSAYAGAIPVFDDRTLSGAAASILADEAMHWAVLRSALGLDPVPGAFFS